MSPEEIKRAADKAEGIKPDQPEAIMGRPPKYKPTFAAQAAKLCALGATDANLADFFEVTIRTIINWRSEHPEFFHAVTQAKEAADTRVVRSLYERANGYEHDAVKIFMPAGAAEPVYAPYREQFPPDTAAIQFWLKNRQPELWRDRQEFTGKDGGPIETADVSDRELAKAMLSLLSKAAKEPS